VPPGVLLYFFIALGEVCPRPALPGSRTGAAAPGARAGLGVAGMKLSCLNGSKVYESAGLEELALACYSEGRWGSL